MYSQSSTCPRRRTSPAAAQSALRRLPRLSLLAALVAAACARSPYPPPPESRRVAVVDTINGVAFEDPYRWLENQDDPEVRAWIDAQNAYADTIIGHPPLRADLEQRFRQLMDVPAASGARRAGEWEYFTLRKKGDETASIYRRKPPASPGPVDPAGDYEKVVDAASFNPDGTVSLTIQSFSPDGRLLAYGVRDGGRDEFSVRILDLQSHKELPDSLPPALYNAISFDRSGRGLYYGRRSRTDGERIRRHWLGTSMERDSVIFGEGYAPYRFPRHERRGRRPPAAPHRAARLAQ